MTCTIHVVRSRITKSLNSVEYVTKIVAHTSSHK